MKNKPWLSNWSFIVILLLVGSTAWAGPIRISGTGAAISTIKQVTEAYRQQHPEIQWQFLLPPMGSSGAIKALTTHQLDVALTGRPLKKEEESTGLTQEWIGRSPFIFVVHKNLPVTNISMAQLTEMYAGRQKVWPDGSRVRVVLRPAADADTTLLKSLSPAMDEAITTAHAHRAPGSAMADTDIDLADMVEKVPGGLGAVALTLILAENRPLKGLILDGKAPTVEALENNSYLHSKPLFVVTRTEASEPVRGMVDFIHSAQARALLAQFGISVIKR
ncbi:MAG: substrate-binding domain-containing protein [Magnetococcus sp. YQC-5]